jgi:hypothetical protein
VTTQHDSVNTASALPLLSSSFGPHTFLRQKTWRTGFRRKFEGGPLLTAIKRNMKALELCDIHLALSSEKYTYETPFTGTILQ